MNGGGLPLRCFGIGKKNNWQAEKGGHILQIEYKKKAVKYINTCDKATKKRLKEAIEKIPLGDIKKLKGLENDYSLRVGNLRVLFTLENDIIIIDEIGPRGQIYKKL